MSWIDGFELDAVKDKAEVYDALMKGQGVDKDSKGELSFFTKDEHDLVCLSYAGNNHILQITNMWTTFELYLSREEFLSLCTLVCKHFEETIGR